jgi:hypothetical protein
MVEIFAGFWLQDAAFLQILKGLLLFIWLIYKHICGFTGAAK